MVGDPVCAEPAVRPIPGGDAIEGGQDESGSKGAIGRPEGPDGGAIVDHRTESRLVGVAPGPIAARRGHRRGGATR